MSVIIIVILFCLFLGFVLGAIMWIVAKKKNFQYKVLGIFSGLIVAVGTFTLLLEDLLNGMIGLGFQKVSSFFYWWTPTYHGAFWLILAYGSVVIWLVGIVIVALLPAKKSTLNG